MLILAVAVSLVLTYVFTPVARYLAIRFGAIDSVGGRKIHKVPTPRLGGLAIYLAYTVATMVVLPHSEHTTAVFLGGTLIFLLGAVDDIRGISPRVKLAGQIIASALVAFSGVRVEFMTNPWDGVVSLGIMSIPVTIVWLVGITNALNLIDGLDGLAAGVASIAAITLAAVAWLEGQYQAAAAAMVLAGSAVGFLRFNFYPAKIFMGDSGAMFLGFNLAVLAILGMAKSTTVLSLLVPVLALGLPILDTSWTILRRLYHGRPIFSADKGHLHHQLLRLGLSQRQAVLLIYGMHTSLSCFAVLLAMLTTSQSILMLSAIVVAALVLVNLLGLSLRQVNKSRIQDHKQVKPWEVRPPI